MEDPSVVGPENWRKSPFILTAATPTVAGVLHHVAVPGGRLAVDEGEGTTAPVLAIHGISSHRRLWDWLRAADPDITLVAPDLRGRADSVGLPGPSSIAGHAADMVAVLDALGLETVTVLGMSMGAFVAVELATSHPTRVRSLALVDGGFPMATPPGLTPELVPVAFQDRLGRLTQSWPDPSAYRDFFVSQTAPLLDRDDPILHGYLSHDLDGDGRVRLDGELFLADAVDVFFGEHRWTELTAPTHLLTAEWWIGADTPGAYSDEAIDGFRRTVPALATVTRMAGADHAATIMTARGGQESARLVREALA